ncbi:MAG: Na+/H+ antiporter NhaC family protein [Tannerella sp.]|jgi:Na+/H+ antiporter NhaC|nr:Na+/H+ antiporter NhaC family protein [Tannerella sp.]
MSYYNDTNPRPSGKALLPLGVFFLLYIITFIFTRDLSDMPVSVAFLTASVTAIALSKGRSIMQRIEIFCRGSANSTIMLMVVIFILAGAFSGTARAMGAVDATVNMILYLLPENIIMASIFLAACFISISMGTSCGTIAALTPIAVGISTQTGLSLPMLVGVVIGGSMFGDNLSFISDTTIVATRTQQVEMKDKFKANFRLVMPVAVLVLIIYVILGFMDSYQMMMEAESIEWLKVIPYLVVLITALCGVNVITVLSTGIVLSGIIGLITHGFSVWEWCSAVSNGIVIDMGELIIVSLMAGGMFEIIRFNGGISWLILHLTNNIHSPKQAEGAIAGLVAFTDLCTANNTIALIITGPLAKQIGEKFSLNPKRIASLIDTVSCSVQSLLPYGAQLLIAAGLAPVSPVEVIPYLYYPFLLGITVIISILFRKQTKQATDSTKL